jgi:hypothetical protein
VVEMMNSKKAIAMVTGMVAAFLSTKIGLDPEVTVTLLQALAGIIGSYIIGQGIADHGKEAEKIKLAGEVMFSSVNEAVVGTASEAVKSIQAVPPAK